MRRRHRTTKRSHSLWHWASASRGQGRVPTVCGGVPRGQKMSTLQFQSRVRVLNRVRALDEQWAASLGSRPSSVAAVFGGIVPDLHNGTLTACQPRCAERTTKVS